MSEVEYCDCGEPQCTSCGKRISQMFLEELRETALTKFLASLPPTQAITYLYECMKFGGHENLAWELMHAVHGDSYEVTPKSIAVAYTKLLGNKGEKRT